MRRITRPLCGASKRKLLANARGDDARIAGFRRCRLTTSEWKFKPMKLDEIAPSHLSPLARQAWECSFLADVSWDVTHELLQHAWEWRVESGEIFYRGAHHANMAMLGIVASGRLRIFVHSAEGRQATVRYAETGAVVGLPAVLSDGGKIDGEVIADALIVRLSPSRFCELAQRDGGLAYLVARYLAEQLAEAQDLLAADLFADVRARVARHLLDLAMLENGRFVVLASHQNIADAIGSVREVVTRSIKRLEAAGLVTRDGRLMVLLNRAALHEVASGHEPSGSTPLVQTNVRRIHATRQSPAIRR